MSEIFEATPAWEDSILESLEPVEHAKDSEEVARDPTISDKPFTTIYVNSEDMSQFVESLNLLEPTFTEPNPNAMVIYQNPFSTLEGEKVWDYEVLEPISSFNEDLPSSSTSQPS